MANREQLERLLKEGVDVWNQWRRDNLSVKVSISQVDLSSANLRSANFHSADLSYADLRHANFRRADLSGADLSRADLSGADLSGADLSGADLSNANLGDADLSGADLSNANLGGADLSDANLSTTQVIGANFTGANLMGACIQDWNINSETRLDDVECEYIYLKANKQERRPSDPNRDFARGEFTKLFQKALSTVDLIFRDGVDWQALLIALEKLRVEADGAELTVQAIENKNDGAFVVRVNVPPDADKAAVEKFVKQQYDLALKVLEQQYHHQLQAKDREIELHRQQGADLMEIARLMASRPINVEARATAESQSMAERNINTGGGSYYETINTGGGNYIQGNYVNMSQDLTEAARQIQELLNQLQKSGVTIETAQEQVATDLAKQAESNPTVMGKLVGWGKTLANKASETTVSEAAKAIVPLALKLVGIPLP